MFCILMYVIFLCIIGAAMDRTNSSLPFVLLAIFTAVIMAFFFAFVVAPVVPGLAAFLSTFALGFFGMLTGVLLSGFLKNLKLEEK